MGKHFEIRLKQSTVPTPRAFEPKTASQDPTEDSKG